LTERPDHVDGDDDDDDGGVVDVVAPSFGVVGLFLAL
jgi:hypothetical protein